ncbi:MAG TPA: efflux RND transporter periplasmic adaptor subunit [Planctomycetes bacterium]|nr:efflux RND transporter periplasmic adaptor subunit [Planctomycetota bacterium]
MKTFLNRVLVLVLFTGLVVTLLWFQGFILRHEPMLAELPDNPRLQASQKTAKVLELELPRSLRFPGFIEAIDPVVLGARVMANIQALTVQEGDQVRKGQVLVKLDNKDIEAKLAQTKAALAAAKAQEWQARRAFARAEKLRAKKAITEAQWEQAKSGLDAAEAMVQKAQAALTEVQTTQGWFQVEAPVEGRVLQKFKDSGELALPGQPLLSIYDPGRLKIRIGIPESLRSKARVGQTYSIHADGGKRTQARLLRVLPQADSRTGTITLELQLLEPKGLQPGVLAQMDLDLGKRKALVVPASAILKVGQVEHVHLVVNGRIENQVVRTGKLHPVPGKEDQIEILAGLEKGEEVVIR